MPSPFAYSPVIREWSWKKKPDRKKKKKKRSPFHSSAQKFLEIFIFYHIPTGFESGWGAYLIKSAFK